jgi:tetratricopeptide (TPR) repeat protein
MAKLTKRTTEQLQSYLGSLSAAELVEVLLSHAARDNELRDRLLIEAARRGAAAVDLKSFQRSIDAAAFDLAESRHGSEHTSGEWAYGVNQVAQRLGELLGAGQAAAVVALAEHALEALVEVMERADDSSGYIADLVAAFERLHHDACISARPEPIELASRLFTWEVDGHWDVFVDAASRYADVLGPEGVARFRQLAEERWSQVRPAGPSTRDAERWRASYRITRVMERLAELAGDIDELVAVKSRDLSMPYDWLEVAEVYASAGRHEEALDWAERGVAAFPDQRDPRLDEFLCEAYDRAGRHPEAVELAWQRFQARPELATYQRLADHATKAGAWSEWRPRAVAVLRERIEAGAPFAAQRRPDRGPVFEPVGASHLVEVLLWEGDDEAAWREAVEASVPHRIWMRLANIRQDERPEDAIPIFQREVEQLIGTKNNRGYAEAVSLMVHVRDLLASAGRPDDYGPYATAVRTAHKPKRNLMKLLDQREW